MSESVLAVNGIGRRLLGIALVAIAHFIVSIATGTGALLAQALSRLLTEFLLTLFFALSVPALIYRYFFGEPVGLDLLSWKEAIVDSLIYGVLIVLSVEYVRQTQLTRAARLSLLTVAVVVLVALGGWLGRS